MQRTYTSLPAEPNQATKDGSYLVGDDFTDEQLILWFSQEQEAFYEDDAGNSEEDPWYAYMRFVNEVLGFEPIRATAIPLKSMLVIGPGSGVEVQKFPLSNPDCQLNFLEASEHFKVQLRERFPTSHVIMPLFTGEIALEDNTQDVVCAFSVLHHIPNVSKVISEVSRVMRPGGFFIVREPCSSMGDWRGPRSATPNERGISRQMMLDIAERAGFELECLPVPIILEPINKIIKRTIGFKNIPFPILYRVDRMLSRFAAINDHYWRDSFLKKIGPSSYFYLFRKKVN